jgi:hypothetical protein
MSAASTSERAKLIARDCMGYGVLRAALEGVTPAEVDWRPSPEGWSVRDVVHTPEHAAQIRPPRLAPLPATPSGAHGRAPVTR